jgi:hypothetical protein
MKKLPLIVLLWGFAAASVTVRADTKSADTLSQGPTQLDPSVKQVVYVAYGRATIIQLSGNKHAPYFTLGAPIIQYTYDANLNQIRIFPDAEDGETNLTMTIDRKTYVTIIKIIHDKRLEYLRTFTVENENADQDDAGDEAALSRVAPMKPVDVDIVHLSQEAERLRDDPIYRATKTNYHFVPIGKSYTWNDSRIFLLEVHQFVDNDLLLFKIDWVNHSREAVYLNARQYGISVAGHRLPVLIAMQDAPNSVIYPGQHETVWLVIQGYRIRRANNFELILPPDARSVTSTIRP